MDVINSTRRGILLAFMALPLLLISFTFFIAIGLGNLGLFVLFVGQVVIVPIAAYLTQVATSRMGARAFRPAHHLGQLVPSEPYYSAEQNVAPSWWMAQTLFFLSYLMSNAVAIYMMEPEKGTSEWQIANRKAKAISVMSVVALVAVLAAVIRYSVTGMETVMGTIVAFAIAAPLGYGWYQFAALCGARHADVFGIVQQILPKNAKDDVPMTCVYSPSASTTK